MFLKTVPTGEPAREALRRRLDLQLVDLTLDPMTAQIMEVLKETTFEGRILDVGCYSGWLYHYLGKPAGYTGIDRWLEAIEVAKEYAPEADFRHISLEELTGQWDMVWCGQVIFEAPDEACKKMKALAPKGIIVSRSGETPMETATFVKALYCGLLVHAYGYPAG